MYGWPGNVVDVIKGWLMVERNDTCLVVSLTRFELGSAVGTIKRLSMR